MTLLLQQPVICCRVQSAAVLIRRYLPILFWEVLNDRSGKVSAHRKKPLRACARVQQQLRLLSAGSSVAQIIIIIIISSSQYYYHYCCCCCYDHAEHFQDFSCVRQAHTKKDRDLKSSGRVDSCCILMIPVMNHEPSFAYDVPLTYPWSSLTQNHEPTYGEYCRLVHAST